MPTWTLQHASTTQSLAAWGMSSPVIQEQSFTAGQFTAQIAGDMTTSLPWVYRDAVVIARDGVVQFRGTVMPDRRQGEGNREGVMFRAVDPWWWLGQGLYTQDWWDSATEAAYKVANVALFAYVTPGTGWELQSIGAEITAIIAHCNALHGGSVMQLGTLSGAGFALKPVPQREQRITHEAALRRCLQWIPDAVPRWDHTTTVPTLHITQRAAATARSYSFCDGIAMMSQAITKRTDLGVTGVRIVYQGIDLLGNPSRVVDSAGATSGSGVVETAVDLTGSGGGKSAPSAPSVQPGIEQAYTLVSEDIDPESAAWWFRHGDTGVESVSDIYVIWGTITLDEAAPENSGKVGLGGCTRQWLSGGIPQALADNHTRVAIVKASMSVHTVYAPDELTGITFDKAQFKEITVRLPTTDLTGSSTLLLKATGNVMGGGVGDAMLVLVETGLAAELLAIWEKEQFEGALRITRSECDEVIALGDVVNWTGGLTEWETMDAQVQSITRNIDTGTTEITLGVAAHLSLSEFMELSRALPNQPALDLPQQATGETPTGDPSTSTITPLVSPGSTTYKVLEGTSRVRAISASAEMGFTTDEEEE